MVRLPHLLLIPLGVVVTTSLPFRVAFAQDREGAAKTEAAAEVEKEEAAPQSAPSPRAMPIKLDIARRNFKNFLLDEEASSPYRSSTGEIRDLEDVFTVGSVKAPFAVFWDPAVCRMLGVLDLRESPESPDTPPKPSDEDGGAPVPSTPYRFLAEGPAPLFGSPGISGNPRFFGLRLVDGAPEFLYTYGTHSVEERIWLEDGGETLKIRYSFREPPKGLKFTFPESWSDRIEASSGTWKSGQLSVPSDFGDEILFTFRLRDASTEPSGSQ